MGDPAANVIDHEQKRSLLGTAGLAIIFGCLERADVPVSQSLEKALDAMVNHGAGQPDDVPPSPGEL